MPASTISKVMVSIQFRPPVEIGGIPAAAIFSAVALYSAQVVGSLVNPILSAALVETQSVLMRWTCNGKAIQLPSGLCSLASSGGVTLSNPVEATIASRLTVGAILDQAAISGPFQLRHGRRIAGDDVGPQLVHHVIREAGDGAVFPRTAGLGEQLADLVHGAAGGARGPLRDDGQPGLHARLGPAKGRQREASTEPEREQGCVDPVTGRPLATRTSSPSWRTSASITRPSASAPTTPTALFAETGYFVEVAMSALSAGFIGLGAMGGAIAATLAKAGKQLVDVPVSGGPRGASEGTLAAMVAGEVSAVGTVRPFLDIMAGKVFVVGQAPGLAQMMKLVNNLISAANMAGAFEALVIGAKAGLEPDLMVEVVNASTGRNSATVDKIPKSVLPGTFDYGARMDIFYKDVTLGLAEAEALNVPTWALGAVVQLWRFAMEQGGGAEDYTSVIKHIERWGGAEVRSRRTAPHA